MTENKGYSLRQAAKLSGVPTMTFHAWKEKGLVTPDLTDEKGNFLFSEMMIERAKEIDAKRKAKKSTNLSVNLFEDTAPMSNENEKINSGDDSDGEVNPREKEKVVDTDADVKDVIEVLLPVETFETLTTIEFAPASEIITLEDRANRIRKLQADVQRGIIEIGFELIAAKKEIGHGGWADWLATNFDWTQQTANRFMRVSERFGKLNNVVQFKPSTLQAMLSLPEGDENSFIAAQSEAGKPIEDLSAREVQKAVKDWNKIATFSSSEKTNNVGKIAAFVAPCVEEESISEDTSPASPSFDEKPVDVKFKLNAMENFRTWQAFIAKFGETVEENQLNKLINLFGEYWLELGKPLTYEKNLIRIAERILACVKEICKQTADLSAMVKIELRRLNGGDSDDDR